jgi:hypothetical protein
MARSRLDAQHELIGKTALLTRTPGNAKYYAGAPNP